MAIARITRISRTITLLITMLSLSLPAYAQYSGGTGEPNDPYQIATAEDLILLGNSPEDYDKHFIMTVDIDLDPNLPGRKIFDKAVIAWDSSFRGVFDGNGHTISNITIRGGSHLGLFGRLNLKYGASISNLGLEAVDVSGTGDCVGGIVGLCDNGSIISSYSTGMIYGGKYVGGLVGLNVGTLNDCYSTVTISGDESVGGLVGCNTHFFGSGSITKCYSEGNVIGTTAVGGLVGDNYFASVTDCYSFSTVSGIEKIGGLVGEISYLGFLVNCYSAGLVSGIESIGGLVGAADVENVIVTSCFWDIETSGQTTSAGGIGLTTTKMQTASTFLEADWDFIDETDNGTEDIWKISEDLNYPRLSWEKYGGGTGEPNDPYLIYTVEHLNEMGAEPNDWDKHFVLGADIDLDPTLPGRRVFGQSLIHVFTGVFDGNDHTISHLTIDGVSHLGLFGQLGSGAKISNLGLEAVDVNGIGDYIGGLVGDNDGNIYRCSSTGTVNGDDYVGGLVGKNRGGKLSQCYNIGSVKGDSKVGGLVGSNISSTVYCFSTGTVVGKISVGGLVGANYDQIVDWLSGIGQLAECYSTANVYGENSIGGLVGDAFWASVVTNCFSSGSVSGTGQYIGGLIGVSGYSPRGSFWDIETSGQATSDGGIGLTTSEMQTARTFLEAGWDFVDETANGSDDIWWIDEGQDYPRLWWEAEGN